MIKLSGFLDALRTTAGYHDTKKLSEQTGIPKEWVDNAYHKVRMPNTLLYGYDAAAKDLKQLYDKDQHYRSLQAELVKIKQGSPEENLFLKKNKKELDNRLRDFVSYADSLEEKYSKLKMVRTR